MLLAVLLLGTGWFAGGGMPAPGDPAPPPETTTLFDFDAPTSAWRVVNDGVMGGRSQGFVEIDNGTLSFTGTLVTRGGGFTSLRARKQVDLSAFAGIELRVRGGGRTFEIDVDDGTRFRGRSVSRRAPFPTTTTWQTVRIPFNTLGTSVFGRRIRAEPIDPSQIRSLGLFIADGRDGPFELEVDWIRAYPADA